jgi:polysaccharide export outer membrane protein
MVPFIDFDAFFTGQLVVAAPEGKTSARYSMIRVEPLLSALAVFIVASLAMTGSALGQAQPEGAPSAPIAVNAPGAAPDAQSSKPSTGPQPISAASPRVGPAPPGQAIAADYRIGPSDLLEIQVFGIDNLKRDVRVNSRGAISLPLVGAVIVGGLTGEEAEQLIAEKYAKDYLQDPQVSVFIKEYTSQRITLEGAIAKPGIYPIRGDTSLMQAIAIGGGQGQLPDLHEVLVYRREEGERKMYTYDLDKIRAGEAEDPPILNDDVIVIKRVPGRVAIRDSILGDFINILNPFNYLPRY